MGNRWVTGEGGRVRYGQYRIWVTEEGVTEEGRGVRYGQ